MYKVTVSVENEKYCGEFVFGDLYDAANKVVANVYSSCRDNNKRAEKAIKRAFSGEECAYFWCQDERGSYCKVERI